MRLKVQPGTPVTPAPSRAAAPGIDPRLQVVLEGYKRPPDDDAAVAHLINAAAELSQERTLSALEARKVEQVNRARAHEKRSAIARTVNDAVTKEAPDVDLELFWTFANRAQAETPRHLTRQSERIEWQMHRAIDLARSKQAALISAASASSGASTVPGRNGGSPATAAGTRPSVPTPPGAAAKPKTFVEQMKAHRAWW